MFDLKKTTNYDVLMYHIFLFQIIPIFLGIKMLKRFHIH